jgi:hypothetical protein
VAEDAKASGEQTKALQALRRWSSEIIQAVKDPCRVRERLFAWMGLFGIRNNQSPIFGERHIEFGVHQL